MKVGNLIFALGAVLALQTLGVGAAVGQSKAPPLTEAETAATPPVRAESLKAERALVADPDDRTARLQAARAHLEEGAGTPSRIEAARQHALAILETNPRDTEALLLAGQTSLLKGDPASAARYYRAATQSNANNATAFLGLGDALTRLGDEPGATAAFARYRALTGLPPLDTASNGKPATK